MIMIMTDASMINVPKHPIQNIRAGTGTSTKYIFYRTTWNQICMFYIAVLVVSSLTVTLYSFDEI